MCYVDVMTPEFALDLSFDRITLLQRRAEGWQRVGAVALKDSAALDVELAKLRRQAQERAPGGFTTALVIPEAEVRYTQVAVTAADAGGQRAEIRAAVEGETPYALDEIAFDWEVSAGTARVALVARETLEQAEEIARRHRFNPACFTAAPHEAQFPRAPDFGASSTLDTLLPEGDALAPDRCVIREGARPDAAPSEPDGSETPAAVAPAPTRSAAPAGADFKDTTPGAPASAPSAPDGLLARARGARAAATGVTAAAPARGQHAAPASAARTAPGEPPAQPAPPMHGDAGTSEPPADPTASPAGDALGTATPQRTDTTDAGDNDPAEQAAQAPADNSTPADTSAPVAATKPGRKTRGRKGAWPAARKPAAKRATGMLTGRRRGPASPPTAHPPEPRRLRMAEGAGDGDEPVTVFGAAEAQRARRRRRLALGGGAVVLLAAAVGLWATALWFDETQEQVLFAPPTQAPATPATPDFGAMDTTRVGALDTPRIPVDAPPIGALTQSALSRPHIPEPIVPAREYALSGGGIAAATPEAAFTRHRFDVVLGPPPLLPTSRSGTGTAAPDAPPPDAAAILAATPDAALARAAVPVDVVTGAPPVIPDPAAPDTETATPPVLDGAGIVVATTPAAVERQRVAVEVTIGEPPILPAPRAPDLATVAAQPPVLDGGGLVAATPDIAFDRRRPAIEVVTGAPPLTPALRAADRAADAPPLDGGGIVAVTPETAFEAARSRLDATAPESAPTIASDPALSDFRPEPRPAATAATAQDDATRRDDTADALADAAQAAELRAPAPRTRPDSVSEAAAEVIAAREDAFATATENAVATAPRPDDRPQNFAESRAVQRATETAAQQAEAAQADAPVSGASTPAESAPTPSAPDIPASAQVAEAATNAGMLNLRRINLIGVFGGNADRRALVRMSNGRMVRVGVGDELDGGRVAAIDESALRYVKRGRDHILRVGGDS